jgi:small GTP-binding protein
MSLGPIKVLLVGDSGVGKSSLMLRFATGTFSEDISATIGIDFKVKTTDVIDSKTFERKSVKMQIWDTAGQERFRTLTSSYYRGAHAVVLVYDVNDAETFVNLTRWLDEAKSFCTAESTVFLLVGNKIDAGSSGPTAVSRERAHAFAKENKMLFCLTSAKTKEGVDDAFDEVARSVCDRMQHAEDVDSTADGGAVRLQRKHHHTSGDSRPKGCC